MNIPIAPVLEFAKLGNPSSNMKYIFFYYNQHTEIEIEPAPEKESRLMMTHLKPSQQPTMYVQQQALSLSPPYLPSLSNYSSFVHHSFYFVTPIASSLEICCPVSFPFLHRALWFVSQAARWLWRWLLLSLGTRTWPFSSWYAVSWLNILDHAPLLSQVKPTMSSRLLYAKGRSCLFCLMLTTHGLSLWSFGTSQWPLTALNLSRPSKFICHSRPSHCIPSRSSLSFFPGSVIIPPSCSTSWIFIHLASCLTCWGSSFTCNPSPPPSGTIKSS
mmetsp:Transcript_4466/g.13209  ORF Transcript_4466/g.13209 Transcript_4466/m.13209 type:complete len:273 (+) Transcript_4466:1209-2027(+)